MKLIKRDFNNDFFKGMDRYFDYLENMFELRPMSTEITEDEKAYYLDIEMPGIKKENIEIKNENNTLVISYERETSEEKKSRRYISKSISYGKFKNAFSLPENADSSNINAKYDQGILKISIPKKKTEKVESKNIAIE